MTEKSAESGARPQSREDVLAAKLRENLHRRKAQARAITPPAARTAGGESGESRPQDGPPPAPSPESRG
ncbi:hypothetical protein GTZ99_10240 [Novosphingobium sp. FSY-8]|uniref:Uncharacterized protein n=2 Tax=Novosphingobium ovatum TaxID=1908523 RepID=A0ABW9XEG9_9SPHN|nr:hypothetical protein [Novosphingobium ovatum]